ncbi:MAG: TlpA disulfide reductase family protein, partial [Bacteroidota bacterium]
GIEYDYQLNVARYPMYHSYHFNDYEPTEIITETYQGLSLDHEEDAKRYGAYRALVGLVIDKRTEHSEDTILGPLAARLAVLRNIQSPTILEQELKKALYYYNVHVEDIKEMRDRMLALAQSKETKEAIDKRYAVISELQPGSFSPSFNYENYAGGHTGLEDFRGKYVYVDVWATWCGPCIKEIPHLKKMEEDFRDTDLAFVSISIDDLKSREKWRRMIADRELGGTQLLADRDWESEFIRSYGIRGIPHFILLDDRGRIVSAEVERPSDPKLRERLQTLDL